MKELNHTIAQDLLSKTGQIAILIDPDKISDLIKFEKQIDKINSSKKINYVLIGGSKVEKVQFDKICQITQQKCLKPIIFFPGKFDQTNHFVNAIFILSLLSGDNLDYLINQHKQAAVTLANLPIEKIPVGYILIDGGIETAVQKISKTSPINQENIAEITSCALAGIQQGKKIIYLDCGSGAIQSISNKIIENLNNYDIPLIVGGGIRDTQTINRYIDLKVKLIVIGNHVEENPNFLDEIERL